MSIVKLDQNTINQIAAGEVVDRPSSIVKELMENSIDAGASSVTVEIKDGGISLIRVTDNGSGIDQSDIRIAFERHATSKIKNALDLADIGSLGFRGEALSSIAAIAQVEMITKTNDSITGFRYAIEGGKEISFDEIGAPSGTTFVVRNIFYNTPARRKFLKSSQTEGGYISEIVEKIALSHPEISFDFIVNGKNKLHTPGNGNLKDTIYSVFGKNITDNLIEVSCQEGDFKMEGYIGKAIICKGNRTGENYFINNRYIKGDVLTKAIEDGYKFILMQHKYPFCVLNFTINTDLIDVNVHPSKMELRFRNASKVYPIITDTIAAALVERPNITEISLTEEKQVEDAVRKLPEIFEDNRRDELNNSINSSSTKTDESSFSGFNNYDNSESNTNNAVIVGNNMGFNDVNVFDNSNNIPNSIDEKTIDISRFNTDNVKSGNTNYLKEDLDYANSSLDDFLTEEAKPEHKIIGQVFGTYWIVEYMDNMYIIDQHAAHEKVNFELFMKRLKEKNVSTQMLATPIILSLSIKDSSTFLEYIDKFNEVGYQIEHFGGQEFAVRGVPADMYNLDSKEVLQDIIDNFTDDVINMVPDTITDKIASMSCKAAVKGNTKISYQEADYLITQLLSLENPYNCPHGRPTIIAMSKTELEKKFKRIIS